MNNSNAQSGEKAFLSNPEIIGNYGLLQKTGIFEYIDHLDRQIQGYKSLLAGALDIFNRTVIEEIMDTTVRQILDRFSPSLIVFIWKPLQNREDITVRSYKNYKPVDINLKVDSISAFEPFFRNHPKPTSYQLFSKESGQSETAKSIDSLKPELAIPIIGPSDLYGMVLMGQKILGGVYSPAELSYIQNLMAFVSQAIQNHLNYERTLRDAKTGLYNNGFFVNRLGEEIARSKRSASKSSVIIIDVDKFKNFNDTYGHLAGDRVLEHLAITIKQGVRIVDIPSRFGGEEFTVLLPEADREAAMLVAERLRIKVAEMEVPWEPPLSHITISLGIFTFDRTTNLDAGEIMQRADEALYLSKELGRNRTTVWGLGLLDKIEKHEAVSKLQF